MGFVRQKPVYANEWAAQTFDKYPFFSFIEIGKALEFRSRALMNSALRDRDMAWHGHTTTKKIGSTQKKIHQNATHHNVKEKEREKHTPRKRKKNKNQQTETHVICIERWKAMLTGPFALFAHSRHCWLAENVAASLAVWDCANKNHFLIAAQEANLFGIVFN